MVESHINTKIAYEAEYWQEGEIY